jgi:hypothetical protein
MVVSLATVKPVPSAPPNHTCVAPENPEPVKVTAVPPAAGPVAGATLEMLTLDGTEAAQATRSASRLSGNVTMSFPAVPSEKAGGDGVRPAGDPDHTVEETTAGGTRVWA